MISIFRHHQSRTKVYVLVHAEHQVHRSLDRLFDYALDHSWLVTFASYRPKSTRLLGRDNYVFQH